MANYEIIFKNNSDHQGDFCVYQQDPDNTDPLVMSLAWYSKKTNPNVKDTFNWTIDYSFVWDETGELIPGVLFEASECLPADLTSDNFVSFSKENGAYWFQDQQTKQAYVNRLAISQDGSIPASEASVGVGMSGAGTFVRNAEPNMVYQFTPHPEYWVTFGTYEQGQVMDITTITQTAEVDFPNGVYSMTATLNADNTWTVAPTA